VDALSDWQINSVGWISARRADYLMAVFTTGNPTEQYGTDSDLAGAAGVTKTPARTPDQARSPA
jgi:hypothetical protein